MAGVLFGKQVDEDCTPRRGSRHHLLLWGKLLRRHLGGHCPISFQELNCFWSLPRSSDGSNATKPTTLKSPKNRPCQPLAEFLPGFETVLFTTSTIASR